MDLWNTDTPIRDIPGLDLEVPAWISGDISPNDVAGIVEGGCANGAADAVMGIIQAALSAAKKQGEG